MDGQADRYSSVVASRLEGDRGTDWTGKLLPMPNSRYNAVADCFRPSRNAARWGTRSAAAHCCSFALKFHTLLHFLEQLSNSAWGPG